MKADDERKPLSEEELARLDNNFQLIVTNAIMWFLAFPISLLFFKELPIVVLSWAFLTFATSFSFAGYYIFVRKPARVLKRTVIPAILFLLPCLFLFVVVYMNGSVARSDKAEHRRLAKERERIVADIKAGVDVDYGDNITVFESRYINSAEQLVVAFFLHGTRREDPFNNYYVVYTSNDEVPYFPIHRKYHWHKEKLSESWYYCYPVRYGFMEGASHMTTRRECIICKDK